MATRDEPGKDGLAPRLNRRELEPCEGAGVFYVDLSRADVMADDLTQPRSVGCDQVSLVATQVRALVVLSLSGHRAPPGRALGMARPQRAGGPGDKARPVRDRRQPARSERLAPGADGALACGLLGWAVPEARSAAGGTSSVVLASIGEETL
jgi:hypothetical protein